MPDIPTDFYNDIHTSLSNRAGIWVATSAAMPVVVPETQSQVSAESCAKPGAFSDITDTGIAAVYIPVWRRHSRLITVRTPGEGVNTDAGDGSAVLSDRNVADDIGGDTEVTPRGTPPGHDAVF